MHQEEWLRTRSGLGMPLAKTVVVVLTRVRGSASLANHHIS